MALPTMPPPTAVPTRRALLLAGGVAPLALPWLQGCASTAPETPLLYQVLQADGATPPLFQPASAAQARAGLTLHRGGRALDPLPGLALAAGDQIETLAGTGAVLRFPDGHEAVVLPGSRVRIGSLVAEFGEVFVRVFQQVRGQFQVKTRYVTAGVEGTAFWLRLDGEGQLSVGVTEGRIRLSSVDQRWAPVPVLPDEVATVLRDAPPTKAQRTRAESDHIVRFVNRLRLPMPRLPRPGS